MNRVNNLISETSSISDLLDHGKLEEEKTSLIHAAKQFQETIKNIKNYELKSKMPLS